MLTPVGNWCEGVTKASRAWGARSPTGSYDDACLVNWHRHETPSCREHRPTRTEVPWILDPGRVTRSQQRARHEIEPALGATGDDDLIGCAAHAARDANVGGDRFPQRGVASWRLIARMRRERLAGSPGQ